MITTLHRLPPVPMTQEDYLISRHRMSLVERLNYLEADMRDAAQMLALGDREDHEAQRIFKAPTPA